MGMEIVSEGTTQVKILTVLSDGKPRTSEEINNEIRLGSDSVESALKRLWRNSKILRTAKPRVSNDKIFKRVKIFEGPGLAQAA